MRILSLLPLLILAACAQQPKPAPPVAPAPPPAPASLGISRIIGHPPERVIALLGSPTLDRSEGPARHLQFARVPCVLDVFFYPRQGAAGVAASHAEARQRDGRPYDAGSCIEAQIRVQPLG